MDFLDAGSYLWRRLPLILLFANGYLAYRLLAVTGLTDAFALRLVRRFRGGPDRVLLAVMTAAALMSFFIPNAITVLTLLPVLKRIEGEFASAPGTPHMATPLALSVIYGANIGGMGSLIGSPANLLLIVALDYLQVPGREQIGFANWFAWSLPLVAVFLALAWLTARLSLPRGAAMPRATRDIPPITPWQRSGAMLFGLFLLFWTASSVAAEVSREYARLEPVACVGFFLYFVFLAFFRAATPCQSTSAPLLTPRDLVQGLPLRGVVLLAVLGAVAVAVRQTGLDQSGADWLQGRFTAGQMGYGGVLLLAASVIFLTELLSNTVVSVAFFPVAFFAAQASGVAPLPLMLAVSLASTCAFMTPVATPCNALACGEMRGVRLKTMLGLGLLLNLTGAALIAAWVLWVVPILYS